MISRGLLKFTDKEGAPAGEILVEELNRMPADWLEKAEARGLLWYLTETPLCNRCLARCLKDVDFDGQIDACDECKPYFTPPPVSETYCEYCRKYLPENPVILKGWVPIDMMFCSPLCYSRWTVKYMVGKGIMKLTKLDQKIIDAEWERLKELDMTEKT